MGDAGPPGPKILAAQVRMYNENIMATNEPQKNARTLPISQLAVKVV